MKELGDGDGDTEVRWEREREDANRNGSLSHRESREQDGPPKCKDLHTLCRKYPEMLTNRDLDSHTHMLTSGCQTHTDTQYPNPQRIRQGQGQGRKTLEGEREYYVQNGKLCTLYILLQF